MLYTYLSKIISAIFLRQVTHLVNITF